MVLDHIVIIGSSAGGPRILKEVFDGLPLLRGAVIIVQHMPHFINQSISESLNQVTEMTVCVARDGDKLKNGLVYVAPSELQLELISNRKIHLHPGEKVNFVCPSIDITMKSSLVDAFSVVLMSLMNSYGKPFHRLFSTIAGCRK